RSPATVVRPWSANSASTGTLCQPVEGALAYGTPAGIEPRSTITRPRADSQRESAPIVPVAAASAQPRATATSSGPTRAQAAATRVRNARVGGCNPATIAGPPAGGRSIHGDS